MPLRGAHVNEIVEHHQIAPLDKFDAHLLGEERMFEIRRIENSRAEHDDRWIVGHLRRYVLQRPQQSFRIIFHGANSQPFEHLREGAFHHFAIFQHVRNAGRAAQVVFQHVELAVAVAHQIGARDVCPNAVRRMQLGARREENICPNAAKTPARRRRG